MIVSCVDLAKTYVTERGEIEAVRGIDFEMRAGEFASIVGRSGSGKSSFLAMIGGLSRPSRGSVRIEDTDLWGLSDDHLAGFRNRRIGFVYQFASLLPTLRIIDNVVLPARLDPMRDTAAAYQRAREWLDRFALSEYLDAYPSEISSGEQRRVVVARALMNDPALLLADEPTSDLDEVTEGQIMELFRRTQPRAQSDAPHGDAQSSARRTYGPGHPHLGRQTRCMNAVDDLASLVGKLSGADKDELIARLWRDLQAERVRSSELERRLAPGKNVPQTRPLLERLQQAAAGQRIPRPLRSAWIEAPVRLRAIEDARHRRRGRRSSVRARFRRRQVPAIPAGSRSDWPRCGWDTPPSRACSPKS